MAGNIQLMANGKEIPGPYLQKIRERWLDSLLQAQMYIRKNGPAEARDIDLITSEELQEIRRIWVVDKHEIEDALPRIYFEATGEDYPGRPLDDNLVLGKMEMMELDELCGEDHIHYELTRELLSITLQQRNLSRRAGLFEHLDKTFRRHFYDDREDALARAERIAKERQRYTMEKQDRAFRVAEGDMIETEAEA
jgi:DNA sulfur modification protein DndC